MLRISNVFTKRIKASDLANIVLGLVSRFEHLPNLEVVVHNGQVENKERYEESTLARLERSHGLLMATLIPEENKVTGATIFINFKKVVFAHGHGVEREIFDDIGLDCTVTNSFLFTLLHEIGHYVQFLTLSHYRILKQADELDSILDGFFSRDEKLSRLIYERGDNPVYRYLSLTEPYADSYALRKIHMVRRELKLLDKRYLTSLDSGGELL
jgi:hypothetical protein